MAAADYMANSVLNFNKWLNVNGYEQYLDKTSGPIDMILDRSLCSPKETRECIGADGKIILGKDRKAIPIYPNNLNIKLNKKKSNLAYKSNPNRDTLIFYLWNYSYRPKFMGNDPNALIFHEVQPSKKPYVFKFNLIEDKFVKKQLKTKGILSYLYFQDDNVLIDEISPRERLGEFIKEDTKFISMSMNKSVTSYILGHAICGGYIDGIDSKINDWPIIQNSLYYNQKLINFLNMNTGDQKYINEFTHPHGSVIANSSYSFEDTDIQQTINQYFQDSVPSKKKYNYNGFLPQLVLNYVQYKTGDDFKKLLNEIFRNKVKIKHSISIEKSSLVPDKYGNLHPMIKATRYDYLRIAKAIMDDYQNDTCVGKYLKTIWENRVDKENDKREREGKRVQWRFASGYGGQFQTHYKGISKKRPVMGMHGRGGQHIVIDFERSRIVVTNAIYEDYNYSKIVYDPIKEGQIKKLNR